MNDVGRCRGLIIFSLVIYFHIISVTPTLKKGATLRDMGIDQWKNSATYWQLSLIKWLKHTCSGGIQCLFEDFVK